MRIETLTAHLLEQSKRLGNAYWDMQGADLARLKQHAPDLYRGLVQRVKQHRANLAQKPAA